jgi:Carbohydrate binding module (family 35)/Carbohydrate binding module (family 6)
MKAPGTGTNPMVTMSLARRSNVPKLELQATTSGVTVGSVNLAPLQNRWIDIEIEMTIGDAPNGKLRWVVRNGGSTVIDATRSGIDNWLTDRVRPKWGIYRSLGDTSGSIQDCFLLIRNMRAYQWSDVANPPPPVRYEAENATISQGVLETLHSGYSGTGYVNPNNATGSSVTWTVNAPAAATGSLTIGYANGTTTNRPMDVTVNGTQIANDLAFLNTLAWDQWETRTLVAPLRAGANTIKVTSATSDGGPNLDFLDVRLPGASTEPPPGTDYQAEDATISQGVFEATHAGFTGTGYVNTDNVVGSYVEFTVHAVTAGPATVTFRYANGTTVNRPMDVTVNGALVRDDLAFPSTGTWPTWATTSIPVTLNAGDNTIRATSVTANGGPNLDKITVG